MVSGFSHPASSKSRFSLIKWDAFFWYFGRPRYANLIHIIWWNWQWSWQGPLCSHFPYHCPQPVQLLAWPFRWQRPADRHGGHLVRTTLLLPWHLSQDIWTFRHIHIYMFYISSCSPIHVVLAGQGAQGRCSERCVNCKWWNMVDVFACCVLRHTPAAYIPGVPWPRTNSSLAQDRSMRISRSRSSLGGSQECITILQLSQPKPFPNVCRQNFQVTAYPGASRTIMHGENADNAQ